jgi:eukaryotic-like serine/threonine-protein kinase
MEYIQHHVTKPPIALELRVQGKTFQPGLGSVLGKALEKRPEDRFASAADFAEALKPFAPGGGKGFSGLFPASSIVLEQAAKSHAEVASVKSPPSPAVAPANKAEPVEQAPRSQQNNAGAQQQPAPAAPLEPTRAMTVQTTQRAPQPIAKTVKMSATETPPSTRPMPTQPKPESAPVKSGPSTLTLVLVAVGFLLVGVVLAVVVLKLIR